MEGFTNTGAQEKTYEPFLESLWDEYDFPGKPPFAGSTGESRLKEACDKYANFAESGRNSLPGDQKAVYGLNKFSSSEPDRRAVHNQIALMVLAKQRSGMGITDAKKVAEFAYEYSRGYKIAEAEKYGK